jgi:hypothetical protein
MRAKIEGRAAIRTARVTSGIGNGRLHYVLYGLPGIGKCEFYIVKQADDLKFKLH